MTQRTGSRPWLTPFVPLYRLGLALRELGLHTGLEPVRRLRRPVISIGNLTTGGAGKTPLTIALARALARRGLQVDVLSRGYGRHTTNPARVDPDGTAEEFGDEPILIAREAGVPVYVAAQRYEAGLLAEREAEKSAANTISKTVSGTIVSKTVSGETASTTVSEEATSRTVSREHEVSEHDFSRATNGAMLKGASASGGSLFGIHLLDDGFQHHQLHRDVNILLLDSDTWFNERLLPAGNLREPLRALDRADILAIPAEEAPAFEQSVRSDSQWQGPIWRLHRTMDVPPIDGPVIAFCGIARPDQFFEGLQNAGLRLADCMTFPDHHRYSARDINRLLEAAHDVNAAALISTEKDRVRLGKIATTLAVSCPLKTAGLRSEIEDEDAAIQGLLGRLSPRLPSSRA